MDAGHYCRRCRCGCDDPRVKCGCDRHYTTQRTSQTQVNRQRPRSPGRDERQAAATRAAQSYGWKSGQDVRDGNTARNPRNRDSRFEPELVRDIFALPGSGVTFTYDSDSAQQPKSSHRSEHHTQGQTSMSRPRTTPSYAQERHMSTHGAIAEGPETDDDTSPTSSRHGTWVPDRSSGETRTSTSRSAPRRLVRRDSNGVSEEEDED